MSGYDGLLDVPDDVLAQSARCPECGVCLYPEDDGDCGLDGCPADKNDATIKELRRR